MNLPTWKKVLVCVVVVAIAFAVLLTILGIDGAMYDRWRSANWLQNLHRAWLQDGAPLPADPNKYGHRSSGTTYVYTASHLISGTNYFCLFAFKGEHVPPNHFAVTTNGLVLVLDDPARVRLLHFSKRGAGAW